MKIRLTIILFLILIGVGGFALIAKKQSIRPKEKGSIVWSENFNNIYNWKFRGKPGTPKAVFSINKNGSSHLNMEADKASGSLVTRVDNIDLQETPFLEWRWKVEVFPVGADGRKKAKDDQAIGIYVGTGSLLNNKSISYRWDTDTPKGKTGSVSYGAGTIKVKWITLRNKTDGKGKWFTERRNVLEDFKSFWGFVPEKIYISISCNSQYTGTYASADLDWIEFISRPKE